MNKDLERYLNDHLAGSCGALNLLQDLAERQELPADRRFFLQLKESVESDQALLESLLDAGDMERSKTAKAAGTLAAKASRLKLLWEGLEPGGLGMLEALEVLALGIQGKLLLWVMLGEIAPLIHGWRAVDFHNLEREAIRQREEVENRRKEAGRELFAVIAPNGS